jgi:transposase
MRYDLTDFKWSVIEPLLPRNHWGVRDRQSGARASVAELEAGLIGERTRPGHAGVNAGLQLHFASCEKIS